MKVGKNKPKSMKDLKVVVRDNRITVKRETSPGVWEDVTEEEAGKYLEEWREYNFNEGN